LHLASVGDPDGCASVVSGVRPMLKTYYARGEIGGYRLFAIKDRDAAEDELLHHMFDYLSTVNERFPFVYAGVQPLAGAALALDEVMREQGFQRFR
jgi:hypothetical protein